MAESFVCPACGYPDLTEPPWSESGGSFEICPSCGIQFGYTDAAGGDIERRRRIWAEWPKQEPPNFVKPS